VIYIVERKSPTHYNVFVGEVEIGAVWFSTGRYWYTHKKMLDYPIGHNPPAELDVKGLAHLAEWTHWQWATAAKQASVTINNSFDCTQREFVLDIARIIYATHGFKLPDDDQMYLYRSQHPTERSVLQAAEDIFELLTGDSPSYDDDELEEINALQP